MIKRNKHSFLLGILSPDFFAGGIYDLETELLECAVDSLDAQDAGLEFGLKVALLSSLDNSRRALLCDLLFKKARKSDEEMGMLFSSEHIDKLHFPQVGKWLLERLESHAPISPHLSVILSNLLESQKSDTEIVGVIVDALEAMVRNPEIQSEQLSLGLDIIIKAPSLFIPLLQQLISSMKTYDDQLALKIQEAIDAVTSDLSVTDSTMQVWLSDWHTWFSHDMHQSERTVCMLNHLPSDWKQAYITGISDLIDWDCVDPIPVSSDQLSIIFSTVQPSESPQGVIEFDNDGLSKYAYAAIFVITLFAHTETKPFLFTVPSFGIELARFAMCSNSRDLVHKFDAEITRLEIREIMCDAPNGYITACIQDVYARISDKDWEYRDMIAACVIAELISYLSEENDYKPIQEILDLAHLSGKWFVIAAIASSNLVTVLDFTRSSEAYLNEFFKVKKGEYRTRIDLYLLLSYTLHQCDFNAVDVLRQIRMFGATDLTTDIALVDIQIAKLLEPVVNKIIAEKLEIGLGGTRFILELVVVYTNSLIATKSDCTRLLELLRCVEVYHPVKERDELILGATCDAYGQALHSELLLSVPVTDPELETHVNITHIANLLSSFDIQVQKNAFQVLHRIVRYQVEQRSLQIELDATLSFEIDASFFTYTAKNDFQFLICWKLVLEHFRDCTLALKSQYLAQIRENELLDALLNFIFKTVMHDQLDITNWDFTNFDVEYYDPESETSLVLLCANIYYHSLMQIPSLVRLWYNQGRNLRRETQIFVESWTLEHFSSRIISNSFADLTKDQDPFFIKTYSNSVLGEYRIEDTSVQVTITFPQIYPLRLVQVDGKSSAGIPDSKFRSWMLNLTSLFQLSYTLAQALTHFKRNLELHFKGIEDCAICNLFLIIGYSIISIDKQIPNKTCRVCSHVFHGSCLYKWFKSSNQNTCPLCRQPF